jgi:hypothetical protein
MMNVISRLAYIVASMEYSMNVLAGSMAAVGTIKMSGYGPTTTAAAPAGAPGIGSGVSVALSDGRTPGKVTPDEEYALVIPTILNGNSKQSGQTLNITV